MKNKIILRADGNSQIGLGHVMRLLALAEMLQPDFKLLFAIQNPTPAISDLFNSRNLTLIPLPSQTDLEKEAGWLKENILQPLDVLVLDGYRFNTEYQAIVRPQVAALFCLDDIHAFPFVADIVVNPAGGVDTTNYRLAPGSKLLTGPDYALLREPFLALAQQMRTVEMVKRIFVNMGGSDPQNHTQWVIQELVNQKHPLTLEVVVGSAYLNFIALAAFSNSQNIIKVNLHQNLSADELANLMLSCDAAICPPSTIAYEWCCVSGPLFIYRTADNQINLEKFLLKEKLAFSFNDFSQCLNHSDVSERISAQIKQQHTNFYGQSRSNWQKLFIQQVYPAWISFRIVQATDSQLLFNWINEPEVRKYSLNPAPVPLEIHVSWFEKKIQDKNSFIFIAELGKEPMGMIRFDLNGPDALISYLLAKDFRGKGLASIFLNSGIAAYISQAKTKALKVIGLVQAQNIPSVKAFEKAGFHRESYNNSQHPSLIKFSLSLQEAEK